VPRSVVRGTGAASPRRSSALQQRHLAVPLEPEAAAPRRDDPDLRAALLEPAPQVLETIAGVAETAPQRGSPLSDLEAPDPLLERLDAVVHLQRVDPGLDAADALLRVEASEPLLDRLELPGMVLASQPLEGRVERRPPPVALLSDLAAPRILGLLQLRVEARDGGPVVSGGDAQRALLAADGRHAAAQLPFLGPERADLAAQAALGVDERGDLRLEPFGLGTDAVAFADSRHDGHRVLHPGAGGVVEGGGPAVDLPGVERRAVDPAHLQDNAYYAKSINEKKHMFDWQFALVLMLPVGAALAAWLGRSFKTERVPALWAWRFGANKWTRYVAAFVGGAVLLFGARMAGGCTSGHGISGGLQLAVGSWVFFVAFFAAGLATAFTLYGKEGRSHA